MSFRVHRNESTAIVEVHGELVVGNRRELRQKVLETLEAGARKVVIDFGAARYIDSSGAAVLVHVAKKIGEHGGVLRIANLSEDLRHLFELTRLDSVFQIADSREAALLDL
ncbi:MAG: STAS domain-containing protein [Gemmatimonadota bacterium]